MTVKKTNYTTGLFHPDAINTSPLMLNIYIIDVETATS